MYQYTWDITTGGLLLESTASDYSKEPRPVFYEELDLLHFDQFWDYPHCGEPLLWAELNNYLYKGKKVAKLKGGSMHHSPEIEFAEGDASDNLILEPIDVEQMLKKNKEIMDALVQDSMKQIYNAYNKYKEQTDIFYVAFSGGKDSLVTLDLVQRALPHDQFMVVFSDTGMEFPDTYAAIDAVRLYCEKHGIQFKVAKSNSEPLNNWQIFGPPCTVTRWCCSVHKTAPQVLLLRVESGKPDFTGFAFVGIRGDESASRGKYDFVSYGGKHQGQYSCYPILNWNSAEVYLYLMQNGLLSVNAAYRKGNRRVGCLVCPGATERAEHVSYSCYPEESEAFVNVIRDMYGDNFKTPDDLENFIEVGGWKARKNGRDLPLEVDYSESMDTSGDVQITVKNPKMDWRLWMKTIGEIVSSSSPYKILFDGEVLQFEIEQDGDESLHVRIDSKTAKHAPKFVKYVKSVFRKVACCQACGECEADCPSGRLHFTDGIVDVENSCNRCRQCHKAPLGCLVYKSLAKPKGGLIVSGKQASLNRYSHHAPKMDWIEQYFEYKNQFDEKNTLGSQMYSFFKTFLRDAGLLDKNGFTGTAEIVDRLGLSSDDAWGIIYVNICYSPQVGWYVRHVPFDEDLTRDYLTLLMLEAGAKEAWTGDIFLSLVRFSELPIGKLGFGKAYREGDAKSVSSIRRTSWASPVPLVILYSLYKYAEACGISQFNLADLFETGVERVGISPVDIFGLNYDDMKRILNGLSINDSDYISTSFTLDLDSITLSSNKNSSDILLMF